MAGELSASGLTAGQTNYYAVLRLAGQFFAGSTPEAYNATHWSTYKIPLVESAPGLYLGNAPAGLPAGSYDYEAYQQSGGSPATTDTRVARRGTYDNQAAAIKAKTDNLPANPKPAGPVVLAAAGLDAIPVEAGINVRQALSPILAAAAGVLSGAGTGTVVIKAPGTTTTRINAAVDVAGNRTATTLTLPG